MRWFWHSVCPNSGQFEVSKLFHTAVFCVAKFAKDRG
jgi:hypothetical protein